MKVFDSSSSAKDFCKKGVALTIGNYDAVHLGHQDILKKLTRHAHTLKIPSLVYTFNPHPVKLLSPQVAPPLLQTLEQKKELLKSQKIDAVIFEKFDRRFAGMGAVDFFKKILKERLRARFIIVGYDFTFGARREGDHETLEQLCFAHGIDLFINPAYFVKDTLVSSSLIRKLVSEGHVDRATQMLGRTFFLDGTVVRGDGRGQTIGVPTANLRTGQELIPKPGVYATRTRVGTRTYASVTNIGTSPTFRGGDEVRVETHLIGKTMALYHKKMRVHFIARIRDEKKFSTIEELVKQIHADIKKAKTKASS